MLERESAARADAVWADESATAAKRTKTDRASRDFRGNAFNKSILILSIGNLTVAIHCPELLIRFQNPHYISNSIHFSARSFLFGRASAHVAACRIVAWDSEAPAPPRPRARLLLSMTPARRPPT